MTTALGVKMASWPVSSLSSFLPQTRCSKLPPPLPSRQLKQKRLLHLYWFLQTFWNFASLKTGITALRTFLSYPAASNNKTADLEGNENTNVRKNSTQDKTHYSAFWQPQFNFYRVSKVLTILKWLLNWKLTCSEKANLKRFE